MSEKYIKQIEITQNGSPKTFEIGVPNLIETSWEDLKDMRDDGELIPGCLYRITDYTCTTTQDDTQSAGHVFDIIVEALDESTILEEAHAIQHDGDDYFTDCKMESWKIWYCLDNDNKRFLWADTENGKGVIYRMIDEFENDIPYDFKNIQFKRYLVNGYDNDVLEDYFSELENNGANMYFGMTEMTGLTIDDTDNFEWKYTFHCGIDIDASISKLELPEITGGGYGYSYIANRNKINTHKVNILYDDDYTYHVHSLNNIVFVDIWGDVDYENGDGFCVFNNSFENDCYNMTFGRKSYNNIFLNSCYNNSFGIHIYNNQFGNNVGGNTFGNYIDSNTFGNYIKYNQFGNRLENNTFGNWVYYNTFGNEVCYNTFGNEVVYNQFGNNVWNNQFGNYIELNTFGNEVYRNTFGNRLENNTFGNSVGGNTFGNNCYDNTFGNDYLYNSTFGNGVSYCIINGYITSDSNKLQYIRVLDGTSGDDGKLSLSGAKVGAKYSQTFGINSNDELILWIPANLASISVDEENSIINLPLS